MPYNVIGDELEEGALFHSNLGDCADGDIRVGMPVALVFESTEGGFVLPLFRPRRGE